MKPARPGKSAAVLSSPAPRRPQVFALLLGVVFALALLKLGNPVIMESHLVVPGDAYEFVLDPWPAAWGYGLLLAVALLGGSLLRWRRDVPRLMVILPALWLGWQILATGQSSAPTLSTLTLVHFGSCVVCFYLGLFVLGRQAEPNQFWIPLLIGFAFVMLSGFLQHFGGLEATRQYFWNEIYPKSNNLPPDLVKRMSSTRVFATLFYPNTLAGVILLWLPIQLAVIWSWRTRFTPGARGLLMALVSGAGLACLFWSGSKGGWLLMLVLGFGGILALPFSRRLKLALVGGVLVLGLAGFVIKYAGFFQKGATSVVARFDYWEAAAKITAAHPLLGSGPGTFGQSYKAIKRPESEMALITHNDYLEQACDSGIPGFLLFTSFVIGCLVLTWRRARGQQSGVRWAVWLGLLGWSLHATVEFPLYIPALAWPAFALFGWLLAQPANPIDTSPAVS